MYVICRVPSSRAAATLFVSSPMPRALPLVCAALPRPASVLVLAALAAGLAACGQGQPAGGHGFPPAQVTIATVATRDLPVSWEYVGQTTGSKDVEVRARVTG